MINFYIRVGWIFSRVNKILIVYSFFLINLYLIIGNLIIIIVIVNFFIIFNISNIIYICKLFVFIYFSI